MQAKRHVLLESQLEMISSVLARLPGDQRRMFEDFISKVSSTYFEFESERVQNVEMQALYRVSNLLHHAGELREVYADVIEEIARVTGDFAAVLEMYDKKNKTFHTVGTMGLNPLQSEKRAGEVTFEDSFSAKVWDDACEYFHTTSDTEDGSFWNTSGMCFSIVIPLRAPSGFLGALTLARRDSHPPAPEKLKWLKTVVAQLTDAIERRHMDALMSEQQASMVAASKMSELGKMAGGIAHEINTPLALIGISAEQIRAGLENPNPDFPKLIEKAIRIDQTTERIARIVHGLKIFSREDGQTTFADVKIADLVQDTMSLCGEKFRSHHVRLDLEMPPDIEIRGRFTQLSQVLLNLLNNAFDAIINSYEKPWIRVEVRDIGSYVEIAVVDCGPGIDQKTQEKLFQPFFTTKELGKGTGLGLSISLGIVKTHRGVLRLDQKSPNTRFVIELPKNPSKTALKPAA